MLPHWVKYCSSSRRRSKVKIGRSISKYVERRLRRNPEDKTTRTIQSERKIVVEKSPEDCIFWTDPLGRPVKTVTQSQR